MKSALAQELGRQGSPPISLEVVGRRVDFEAETGEFMLRARAADALTAAWPQWQQHVVELRSSADHREVSG